MLDATSGHRAARPGVKSPRFSIADTGTGLAEGIVQFALDPSGARTRVTVTHEKLPDAASGELWKEFWRDWLDGLAG